MMRAFEDVLGELPSLIGDVPDYSPQVARGYIADAAKARGIDPDTAIRVAESEGLNSFIGDAGTSGGPFQLHYGEGGRGFNQPGLGNEFTRRTGLDARDPKTWQQGVDFALDEAKKGGWGPWYGAKKVGIIGKSGIGDDTGYLAPYAMDRKPESRPTAKGKQEPATNFDDVLAELPNIVNRGVASQPNVAVASIMGKSLLEGVAGSGERLAQTTKDVLGGSTEVPSSTALDVAGILPLTGLFGAGGKLAIAANAPKAAPFFSAVSKAVETSPIKTGQAQQWEGWLKNQPGIKQEELDWIGLNDWLKTQKGPVIKQQVSDFLKANQVEVQEIVKGEMKFATSKYNLPEVRR